MILSLFVHKVVAADDGLLSRQAAESNTELIPKATISMLSAEGVKEDCDIYLNRNINAGALAQWVSMGTMRDCIYACRGVNGCNAVTFNKISEECQLRSITQYTTRTNSTYKDMWKECRNDKQFRVYDLTECPLEQNTEYISSRLLKVKMKRVFDPIDCIGLCLHNMNCYGFTHENATCTFHHFDGEPMKHSSTGSTSWTKCKGVLVENPECLKFELKIFTRGMISQMLDVTLAECIQKCDDLGSCYSWSYGGNKNCQLFDMRSRGYVERNEAYISGVSCHKGGESEYINTKHLDIKNGTDMQLIAFMDDGGFEYIDNGMEDIMVRHSGFTKFGPKVEYDIGPRQGMRMESVVTFGQDDALFVWRLEGLSRVCGGSVSLGLKSAYYDIAALKYDHKSMHPSVIFSPVDTCLQDEAGVGEWNHKSGTEKCGEASKVCGVRNLQHEIPNITTVIIWKKGTMIKVYQLPSYDVPLDINQQTPHPTSWRLVPVAMFELCDHANDPFKLYLDVGFCKNNLWLTCPKFSNEPIQDCKNLVENYPQPLLDFGVSISEAVVYSN